MPELADRLNAALAGHYAIQRELGRGGMATVFLAQDLKHGRPVAIKVLHPELSAVIGPERFVREIEIAARMTHPHILPLYDSGAAGELLYYVMPYVEGESLRARLSRERQLPVEDALRLATEVASALDYAHRHGVVHRDIKPENILLADGHAVVADFGIARAVAAVGASKLTETGVTLGTPVYMSPEQAMGSGALDGRSDLYSLGCVLYEMLSGQPPFTGATSESVVHQHLSVAPRPVSVLRTRVPRAVEQAVETALAKAAADRFRTASEFAAAITASGRTGELTAAGGGERGGADGTRIVTDPSAQTAETIDVDTRRSHRRRLAIRIGATSGIVIVLAVVIWKLIPPPPHPSPTPAKRAWMLVAEFDGPAGDSSLVAATRDLMMAALDQSEIVAVVPTEQIRVALQMAGRPTTTRVDAELARELAYRSSVRTVLEGRLGRVGSGYSMVLRVVDVDSGRVEMALSDVAQDEEALIPTLNRLARKLRAELGERNAAIQPTRDLRVVITPSLEAFKAWRRSRDLLWRNDNRGAITWARSSLALDPGFGGPWNLMGFAFSNLGEADSAIHAFHEALARSDRLPPAGPYFIRASLASLSGDDAAAQATYEQLLQIDPDNPAVHNNLGALLFGAGRWAQALERYRTAESVSPFGPSQQLLGNQFEALLMLGRLDECRKLVPRFTGSMGLTAPLRLAMASGQWTAAESLASALRENPAAYADHRLEAEWSFAAALASRGKVRAAEQMLRRVQSEAESAGRTGVANLARWRRLMLALFSQGVAIAPGDPGRWDRTTRGLVAHTAWAAGTGDTTSARRLLASVRTRSAPDNARQAFMPAVAQAWIAARAGRWQEVVRDLGPAVLQGEPRGFAEFNSAPLARWLVAEAYERLGQPDSAVAYFERAIAPPPEGGYDFAHSRMAYSFGHRRLALLYARMGRPVEATRHWEAFSLAFASPDAEMAPWVEEARTSLARAGRVAKTERR